MGVIFCIIGVLTISFGAYTEEMDDEEVAKNSISGIIMVSISVFLSSAVMVGIEYVSDKYFNENNQSSDMIFLQSSMGIFVILIYWPIFFIFHHLNIEKFELPSTSNQYVTLLLTVILNVLFIGSYFMGIVLTNALFISVIIVFVLPIGYFSDVIIYSYISNIWAYLGTSFIIIGFLIMELPIMEYMKQMKMSHKIC